MAGLDSFELAVGSYDQHAGIQKRAAQILLDLLDSHTRLGGIPAGPILEIGCGTGFLSEGLVQRFCATHPLTISDRSLTMVAAAQTKLAGCSGEKGLNFQGLDGEQVDASNTYALIAANFVIQWFEDPLNGILKLLNALQPGGWLALSFPSCHSFQQFRQACEKAEVPVPLKALPDPTPILGVLWPITQECAFQQEFIASSYANGRAFLRHFKSIGATQKNPERRLSPTQLRHLLNTWESHTPGDVTVDYHAVFLLIQKHLPWSERLDAID